MDSHSFSSTDMFHALQAGEDGLTTHEAQERLKQHGYNKLPNPGDTGGGIKILFHQITSPLMILLIIAGIVSGFVGEMIDMTVILFTAVVNVMVGFFQEYKANRALEKLQQMVSYTALVLRDGIKRQIESEEIVSGDILVLDAGEKVQADGRILHAIDLEVDESSLTGESNPIRKQSGALPKETSLADRDNMVYRGTTILSGRAMVLITGTGAKTEIGKIALLVKETKTEQTPLQMQLKKLGIRVGLIVVLLAAFVFFLGFFWLNDVYHFLQVFQVSVALAVAAIPEGLAISLTVILALGMRQMVKKNALVRRLVAAETLGSVSVICTDKTGTITEGNMSITRVITRAHDLDRDEILTLRPGKEDRHGDTLLALRIGILVNDGIREKTGGAWRYRGDSTDTGILRAGHGIGLSREELDHVFPRKDEIPFTSERKYQATLHHIDHLSFLYVKGAFDVLVNRTSFIEDGDTLKPFGDDERTFFQHHHDALADQGLRIIAVAYKKKDERMQKISETDIQDLIFVGLLALSDPIRPLVKETIAEARAAGVRTIMITGDHARTARSIAASIGLPSNEDDICDGETLENTSDEALPRLVSSVSLFVRVNSVHKIRIVQALQKNGEVVAMTGDGVNDAPALKAADIGVAVGSGTDVAKETADMILLDNAYNTIVAAIAEGRRIYHNIKKVIVYLFAGSFSEVFLIIGSMIGGLPLALLPAQILWINIIEETLPVMALSFDRGEKRDMADPPRKRGVGLFDRNMICMILATIVVSNGVLFILFLSILSRTHDQALAQTMMFGSIGISVLFFIYSIRNMRYHIWEINPFDNPWLNGAVLAGLLLLVGAMYLPSLQLLFRTVPLGWGAWMVLIGFGFFHLSIIEVVKYFYAPQHHTSQTAPRSHA